MSDENREAGRRWIVDKVRELAGDLDIQSDWGPSWDDAPARYRRGKPKPATTALLVLTMGQRRKILWLPEDELIACGAEGKCEAVSKKLARAVEFFRSEPKVRQRVPADLAAASPLPIRTD